jgi:pyruvate/2-oxoglutarate dehydrogenase complex dihydrolipoamide dehydrogenase (E3) component
MIFNKKKYDFDLIVIGSGSGGSVAAHYAESLGKKVALFEASAVGGECPNYACVPTKALLHAGHVYQTTQNAKLFGTNIENASVNYHAVRKWKDLVVERTGASHGEASFRKEGITLIQHKAEFVSPHEVVANGKTYSAAKFLLATGSKTFVPHVDGLEETGYITFREAIDMDQPPKSMLIYGGGAIACEFAQIFNSFGTKVTIVNRSERILSKEDIEVSDIVKALFENAGIQVLTNTNVERVEKRNGHKAVHFKAGDKTFSHEYEEILCALGKVPVMSFAPEKAGLKIKDRKLVVKKNLQTSVPHIYAAGDLVGPYLFTHTSSFQSYVAAQNLFSRDQVTPDYSVVPRCVFVSPEVASVGISEVEAIEKKIKIKKGIMALGMLGRANTENEFDGFVKVITDKKGVIIGGSIVAPRAGEMIHEIALAMKCRVTADELADMIHAYPTYSEGIKIACSLVE